MSGLLSGGKKTSTPTVASGLQLQSSVYGLPIPIIYGTTRVAGNLIWYGDFVATPVSQGSKGGKGSLTGGGGKSGAGQYTYQVAFAMALCEGPTNGIGNVYMNKTVGSLADFGLSQFTGTYPQSPWGYLVNNGPLLTYTGYVPNSSPYTVTVPDSNFYQDAGVTLNLNVTFTFNSDAGYAPSENQYFVEIESIYAVFYFSSANAGQNITITTSNFGAPTYSQVTIPSSPEGPFNAYPVQIGAGDGFQVISVVSTGTVLSSTGGTPGSDQYSVQVGGIYTFNSAQAGDQVTINYYDFTDTDALGYNGIAYVAASALQLGQSAALPNMNFEVLGVYSGEVGEEVIGEQDTISNVPYINDQGLYCNAGQVIVEYSTDFISDRGVTDLSGNALTPVGSNPGYYQYTVSGGSYNFSSTNYGLAVQINYLTSASPDADPSLVVADLLTNEHYGAAFPSQYLGNLSVYQAYCIANGLLISMALTSQTQTSQILQDIATNTNSAWVWSNGTLNLIPYGDQTITNAGYTYTAPSSVVVSLNDDNFMKNTNPLGVYSAVMNDNPVIMSRKRPADQINSIKLNCLDRANNYNQAVVEVEDQNLVETFKLRQSTATNTTMFCNLAAAQQSAQLQLQRQYIMNVYSFQLPQTFIYLDPMDLVSITDTNLGLNNQWVRITQITENDDGSLSISAEEYLYGTGNATLYDFQASTGYNVNYNINPGNVNTPVIFEPTDALAGELAVWMAVSGVNTSLWGGCDVYISTNGQSYVDVGRITGAAKQGILTATLSAVTMAATGLTIDQTNTLGVNLAESAGILLSGTQTDATNLNTVCYVDGEYIAYENSALVGSYLYNLTYLVRGAYDSTVGTHAPGSQIARLNSGIFSYPYSAPLIGTTVLIKFLSFNIWGGGQQQLSDVQPYTYTVQGTAYTSALPNVTGFANAFIAGLTQLIWNPVDDFRTVDYEIRQGTTWNNGNVLYRTPLTQGPIAGDGQYWVAAHFTVPNGGEDVYSETPVSIEITGSQITQNVIESYDQALTGWGGIFNNTVVTSLGLQLDGLGNILTDSDYLNTFDILYYGGVKSYGTYEIPVSQRINVGRVIPCQVIIKLGVEVGYSLNAVNILSLLDYLNAQNILGIDLGNNTSAIAQIRLSQDGTTWGSWQNWIPGSYSAMVFDAQVILQTSDSTVLAVLSDFIFTVDVPSRIDYFTNYSLGSGGNTISFTPTGAGSPVAFNGGPGNGDLPAVQVTILNAQQGDTVVVSSLSLSSVTIQVLNGGSGVARSVNVVAEGF